MALALRAAHDTGNTDGGGSGDETPRFGDHADAFGQLHELLPDGRAEARDVRHRCTIVDGKAATDIQRVERAELLAPRGGHECRTRLDGLDVLARISSL